MRCRSLRPRPSSGLRSRTGQIEFYEQGADETFAATRATQSPWDERLQHGSPPTALLAHAMNARNPPEDMRSASISAEFLGPIPPRNDARPYTCRARRTADRNARGCPRE